LGRQKNESLKYQPAILQINGVNKTVLSSNLPTLTPKKNQQSAQNLNSNLIIEGNRENGKAQEEGY
jgi:hypothetical protein